MTAEERKTTEEAWNDLIRSNIKHARLLTIIKMIEIYADVKALSIIEQAVEEEVDSMKYRSDIHPNEHEYVRKEHDRILQTVRRKIKGGGS